MDIREATPEDYEQMWPVFFALRTFSHANHSPEPGEIGASPEATRAYLHEILHRGSEGTTLLAISDAGEIAGYLVATMHEPNPLSSAPRQRIGSIDELYIAEEFRRRGAGSLLMEAAESWFVSHGAEQINVGAYAWNTEAIAYYTHQGFTPFSVILSRTVK